MEKYNVRYFSWFLWEIEIILVNKWGKCIKTGENFIKMCFTEDYLQNIVLKLFEAKFGIIYDYWDFCRILKDKISEI